MTDPDTRVAFVCVQNAGRSQMAAAFARETVEERGMSDRIEVVSGGTDPADRVHPVVVEAMAERDIDIADRTPREISDEELFDSAVVVTMGCSAEDVCPVHWVGDERDWNLDDPHDRPLEAVRAIRDDIERRVDALLCEMANTDE
ncbi:MAG: low molecular weight phosphatase family protein [Halobacteriota archaeon]